MINSIACSLVGLCAPNSVRLAQDANQAVMSLQAVANFSVPSTITVRYAGTGIGFHGTSENNVLTALKVGAIQ